MDTTTAICRPRLVMACGPSLIAWSSSSLSRALHQQTVGAERHDGTARLTVHRTRSPTPVVLDESPHASHETTTDRRDPRQRLAIGDDVEHGSGRRQ
jgi:hypothetical protein